MAITLTHTEVAYLRKKLGVSGRELCDLIGIKSFHEYPNYEAGPARVKSAKPMSAGHCTLLVLIVEYYYNHRRLPPMEYLKEVNLDQKGKFMMLESPEWGTTGNSDPEGLPSAREMMAHQRREAAKKKAKKD